MREFLRQCAEMHEHLCPRQVLGVRMGMHAAALFDLDLPQTGKRLLTIVETDGCFVDGVAIATGCSLGHRTLRWVDYGTVAATFVDTHTGDAVRMHPSPSSRELAQRTVPDAPSRWHAYLEAYQVIPVADLLVIERVRLADPVETLVSSPDRRATCESCGEEVFNGREIVVDGRVRCRRCAEPSSSYLR